MYGTMTKWPWRTKSTQNKNKLCSVATPGECVSVDQLESPQPGFVAQMKGKLTLQCYRAATVFVDHASRLSYVHLQRGETSKETIEAKDRFEAYARLHGVQIQHYHADNGCFADNLFKQYPIVVLMHTSKTELRKREFAIYRNRQESNSCMQSQDGAKCN